MSTRFAKVVGCAVMLVGLGSICIIGVRAQQDAKDRSAPAVSTNWVGYFVAGRIDPYDPITANPSPTVVRQVEIGLRSDGIVVWREGKTN